MRAARPPVEALEHRVATVSRVLARAGGALMLAGAVVVVVDVAARRLAGRTWLESYELTSYAFAVAVAASLAHALFAGAHVRIDVLHARLPAPARRALDVLAVALLGATAALLAWHAAGTLAQSIALGARSNSALGVPLAWPQALWAAGIGWFAVACAVAAAATASRALRGVDTARAPGGDDAARADGAKTGSGG